MDIPGVKEQYVCPEILYNFNLGHTFLTQTHISVLYEYLCSSIYV